MCKLEDQPLPLKYVTLGDEDSPADWLNTFKPSPEVAEENRKAQEILAKFCIDQGIPAGARIQQYMSPIGKIHLFKVFVDGKCHVLKMN